MSYSVYKMKTLTQIQTQAVKDFKNITANECIGIKTELRIIEMLKDYTNLAHIRGEYDRTIKNLKELKK